MQSLFKRVATHVRMLQLVFQAANMATTILVAFARWFSPFYRYVAHLKAIAARRARVYEEIEYNSLPVRHA